MPGSPSHTWISLPSPHETTVKHPDGPASVSRQARPFAAPSIRLVAELLLEVAPE